MSTDVIDSLQEAALTFATAGVPVFPCIPNGKAPLTRHGFLDATTHLDQVLAWWQRYPRANIGTPTGAPGHDVLDVDVRANGSGFSALRRLREAGLTSGWDSAVRTPSGGLHLYFAGSAQPCGSVPAAHIDFRGQGGYVLVPPSRIAERPYRHIATGRTNSSVLDWSSVARVLRPATPGRSDSMTSRGNALNLDRLTSWIERQPEGNRNRGLYWAACRAAPATDDIASALVEAAVRAGLPRREAETTVASARAHATAADHALPTTPTALDRTTAHTPLQIG